MPQRFLMNKRDKRELAAFIKQQNNDMPDCFRQDPRPYADIFFFFIRSPQEIKDELVDYADWLLLENYRLKNALSKIT